MKKFKKLLGVGLALSALFLTSCNNDDDPQPEPVEDSAFQHGIFILNEGNFGAGNASVSFLSDEGVTSQNIYTLVNGEPLGDVGQSIYLNGDLAYIVVNGSGKVEVVNRYSFEKQGTISTGLINPRYMTIAEGKGYVTNWGDPMNPDDDYVAVINLSNYSVSSTIPVAEGPEQIVSANGKLYVAQMGGWGYGNSVSVISLSAQSVTNTFSVQDIPESMVVAYDVLYVLSSGKAAWTGDETTGGLAAFDTVTGQLLSTVNFGNGFHPENLKADNGNLYFTESDKVYSADQTNSITELFSMAPQGVFGAYGFEVKDGRFYVGDAADYISDGTVYIYNNSGTLVNSFTTGPLPNGFGFND